MPTPATGFDPSQPYEIAYTARAGATPASTFDPSQPHEVYVPSSDGAPAGADFDPSQPYEVADNASSAAPAAASSPSDSFLNDFQAGAHTAMDAPGAAFQGVGGIMNRNGVPGGSYVSGAGDWLRGHAPAVPQGYTGRGGDTIADIRQGNYSRAAGDVLHGLAEGAPVAAEAIGAGAALDAVGIPAAAGAALVGGTVGLGEGAESRATAAGREKPDTSDVVGALPRAAGDALASAAELGRLKIGVGGRIAAGAAAGAGQSAVDQFDTTGSVDPEQLGNAAITGAATVGASELPGMASWGVKNASDRLLAATLDKPASTADATSVLSVKADMDAIRARAIQASGTAPADTHIANSVKAEYATRLNGIAADWLKDGLIDRDDYRDLSVLINNQALRHNNTIAEGTEELPTLFSQVDALTNVPDAARDTFKDGVRALNTVSSQSFIKNTVGPFQRIGQFAGRWVPAASALASGNPLAAAAAVMGHGLTGKIAGGIGAKFDQALGLNSPPVVLQAINAARALRAAGIDPGSVKGSLGALQGLSGRPMPTSTVTGAAPDAVPVNTPIRGPGLTPGAAPTRGPGFTMSGTPPGYNSGTSHQFRPNTAADVASALQQDDSGAGAAAPPVQAAPVTAAAPVTPAGAAGAIDPIAAARLGAALGALPGASEGGAGRGAAGTPGTPGTPQGATQGPLQGTVGALEGGFTPGSRYIANRVPGMDHASAVATAREMESRGRLVPGTAEMIDTSPAPIDPAIGQAVQEYALSQLGIPRTAEGAAPAASTQGPWAVDRSEQARVNAHNYQENARALAAANPDLAGTILSIAQGAKTPAAKMAIARSLYAQHPEHIGRLPEWLLNHGYRGS